MKLLSGLIGAFALVISALAIAPAANAAYPGTVATSCNFSKPASVKKNKKFVVNYNVGTSGNARAAGRVTFRVYKVTNGGLSFNRSLSNGYYGGGAKSLGKFHRKGQFRVQLVFSPANGSVFKSCATGLRGFRVKR